MTSGSRSKTPFPFHALARFADNLYRARELSGLDQKEAARRAALTRSRLDKIENGEYIATLDILIRLAGTYSTWSATWSAASPGDPVGSSTPDRPSIWSRLTVKPEPNTLNGQMHRASTTWLIHHYSNASSHSKFNGRSRIA